MALLAIAIVRLPELFIITSFGELTYRLANRFLYSDWLGWLALDMTLIAAGCFLAYSRPTQLAPYALACVLIVFYFVVGARFRVVFLFGTFIVWFAVYYRRRLPLPFLVCGLPIMGLFLSVSKYYARFHMHDISFDEYVHMLGGPIGLFFDSTELVFSRNFLALVGGDVAEKISRAPWATLGAFLLYLVPRNLFPAKPIEANYDFTLAVNPMAVKEFESRTTVGILGEFYMDLGIAGSVLGLVIIGFIVGLVAQWVCSAKPRTQIIFLPMVLYIIFNMYRTGLVNVGQILWPGLFYITLFTLAVRLLIQLPAAPVRANPSDPGDSQPTRFVAARWQKPAVNDRLPKGRRPFPALR